jgi:hypothetical protein
MWHHHNMCWKWPPFASKEYWTLRATFIDSVFQWVQKYTLAPPQYTDTFSNYPVWTHTLHWHKQQPYCVGTLSQMTDRSAERCFRQETGWLAGRPLLHVAIIRCTTDTFLFISHTTNILLFKFHCNIFIGVKIIKEMLGSVASGTRCT